MRSDEFGQVPATMVTLVVQLEAVGHRGEIPEPTRLTGYRAHRLRSGRSRQIFLVSSSRTTLVSPFVTPLSQPMVVPATKVFASIRIMAHPGPVGERNDMPFRAAIGGDGGGEEEEK